VRGRRLAMKLEWVDDGGDMLQVTNATARALRSQEFGANFAMAGYSSSLTQYAALQADADGKLMVAAGSSGSAVFDQNLPLLFGFLPQTSVESSLRTFMRGAAEADAAGGETVCGAAGCVAQLKFGQLGSSGGCVAGKRAVAERVFGTPSVLEVATDLSSTDELRLALGRLKSSGVTVLEICNKLSLPSIVRVTILMSEPELGFEVYALVVTAQITSDAFTDQLRENWWQGAHIIEPSAWHNVGPTRGNISNMTSSEFYSMFVETWGVIPTYRAAAQFCALCALVAAIEQAGSLESAPVADAMRNLSSLVEFYATTGITFDAQGQLDLEQLLLQASPLSPYRPVMVFSPDGTVERGLVFPKPSWAQQLCKFSTTGLSRTGEECSGSGRCSLAGVCQCDPGKAGQACQSDAQETIWDALKPHAAPIVICLLLLAALVTGACFLPRLLRHRREFKELQLQRLEVAIASNDQETLEWFRSGGGSLTPREVAANEKRLRQKLSGEAGISIAYLLSQEFTDLARARSGKEDPSFYDLKEGFFFGDDAIGAKVACPRDGGLGCAFVDTLPAVHRRRSTHFLSWTWAYKLSVIQDALKLWQESSGLRAEDVYLYMCFFVNNQYRIIVSKEKTGSHDLEQVFESNLARIGQVLALLDTWDGPRYLSRIWTIFEQIIAMKLNIPVTIILPRSQSLSLFRELEKGKEGILRVKEALTKVDSASAEATEKEDEDTVKGLITSTFSGGFGFVDKQLVKFMVHWMGNEMETHLNTLIGKDPDSERPEAMHATVRRSLTGSCDVKLTDTVPMTGSVPDAVTNDVHRMSM